MDASPQALTYSNTQNILSKKKFTDGLESLFNTDTKADVGRRGTAFLNPSEGAEAETVTRKRSASRKDFTTDLDTLLEEALQESFEEQMAQKQQAGSSQKDAAYQKQHRRPSSGLDMLIRRTVESGDVKEDRLSGTKRLTVTFDKEKIQKLKKIARMEKAYLKDILGDLVAEYIEKYEKKKGDA